MPSKQLRILKDTGAFSPIHFTLVRARQGLSASRCVAYTAFAPRLRNLAHEPVGDFVI